MQLLLGVILGVLCAVSGILVLGWIGYELLGLSRLRRNHRLRMKVAGAVFGIPGAVVGYYVGHRVWVDLMADFAEVLS